MTTAPVRIRIGHPPQLPHRLRVARLLDRLGRYAVAWAVLVWAGWWALMAHGAIAVGLMVLASIICGPRHPKRRVRRPRTAGAPWHAHYSQRVSPALGRLTRLLPVGARR